MDISRIFNIAFQNHQSGDFKNAELIITIIFEYQTIDG